MREWATSGAVKVSRAREHIAELSDEIAAYQARQPFWLERRANPETGSPEIVVHEREPIPLRLSAITADAAHNLKVALDYGYQLATHPKKAAQKVAFPAYPNEARARERFRGKQLPDRIQRAVDVLFKGHLFRQGNPCWDLQCFDNEDKHGTLSLVACNLQSVILDFASGHPDIRTKVEYRAPRFTAIREGTTFPVAGVWRYVNVNDPLTFEVAFGPAEQNTVEGHPVVPVLANMATVVESVARAFTAVGLMR